MAFIVEDGTGRVDANAYCTADFALTYLLDRSRQAENNWITNGASWEAMLVQASDFIDFTYGTRFRGVRRKTNQSAAFASGVLTGTANFTATETVVIGTRTYTFVASLSSANDILIGADLEASLLNLADAIKDGVGGDGEGSTYGTGTVQNADFTATSDATTMTVTARTSGRASNNIGLSETCAAASWGKAQSQGGFNLGDVQGMEFPRIGCVTSDGHEVSEKIIPERIKEATVEYAVRALSSALQPDPTLNTSGGAIVEKREKVGPIETLTRYAEGSTHKAILAQYPAADRLLLPFIKPGSVYR